eukprot:Em0008g325a
MLQLFTKIRKLNPEIAFVDTSSGSRLTQAVVGPSNSSSQRGAGPSSPSSQHSGGPSRSSEEGAGPSILESAPNSVLSTCTPVQTEDSDNDEQLELFKANETFVLHEISPARKRTMRSKKSFAKKMMRLENVVQRNLVRAAGASSDVLQKDGGAEMIQQLKDNRVMPGKKDFLSVRNDTGEKEHRQKRLVLCNLTEAYRRFKALHPDIKVGFSKFAELRPKEECVLAGATGTHSIVWLPCEPPTYKCVIGKCKHCPRIEPLREELETIMEENSVETVQYNRSWTEHFGDKPKRIIYMSDGCAGQYKNCYNFTNLCHHEEDFGIPAEWHFFATSHGKHQDILEVDPTDILTIVNPTTAAGCTYSLTSKETSMATTALQAR